MDINNQMASGQFVTQGLRGQLSMQSLLTGQLYIDLDFHPETPARLRGHGDAGQLREIPTIPTPFSYSNSNSATLISKHFSATSRPWPACCARLPRATELQTTLHALNQTMHNMERLSARLEQGSTPLLGDIHSTLAETRSAMQTAQSALKEIAAAASDIRTATADNSLLQHNLQRALKRNHAGRQRSPPAVRNHRATARNAVAWQGRTMMLHRTHQAVTRHRPAHQCLRQQPTQPVLPARSGSGHGDIQRREHHSPAWVSAPSSCPTTSTARRSRPP